ncbi:MAG: hypothetical protein WCY01_11715, partial [Alkalispirochaeta sp.]
MADYTSRDITLSVSWKRILLYTVLVIFALYFLLPVYMVIITGLKPFSEVSISRMWTLPVKP